MNQSAARLSRLRQPEWRSQRGVLLYDSRSNEEKIRVAAEVKGGRFPLSATRIAGYGADMANLLVTGTEVEGRIKLKLRCF